MFINYYYDLREPTWKIYGILCITDKYLHEFFCNADTREIPESSENSDVQQKLTTHITES